MTFILQSWNSSQYHPNFSLLSKTTFWDVSLEEVNWKSGQRWAIRRVLEYGEPCEVAELYRFYGKDAFESVIQHIESFRLPEKVKTNWSIVNIGQL